MRKWNPFYSRATAGAELACPVPGAELFTLQRQVTAIYPVPIAIGNMWTKQLVPAPLEAHVLALYHEHPEISIQAGTTRDDAIYLTIDGKMVGDI